MTQNTGEFAVWDSASLPRASRCQVGWVQDTLEVDTKLTERKSRCPLGGLTGDEFL